MSKTYTVTVTLTDEQDTVLTALFAKTGKTVQNVLDQMFDGYEVEGVFQKGPVKSQLDQWITDETKAKLATMDAATALGLLSKSE
jgi:hypothetical protein